MATETKGFGLGTLVGSRYASEVAGGESYAAQETYSAFGGNPHPVITEDVEICGELAFSGELEFNGRFEGSLESDGILHVGQAAIIKGGITAESAVIAGKVQGDVRVTGKVHLRSSAVILGNVDASIVSIEEGAQVQGKVVTSASEKALPDFSSIFTRLTGGKKAKLTHE